MKKERKLIKIFGKNRFGFADIAGKILGTRVYKILVGKEIGYSNRFPHGYEVFGNYKTGEKNWKKFRETQWREK